MEELKKALALIEHYNDMDFGEFINKFEHDTNTTITEEEREGWKFIGLNNIDFYKMHTEI